MDTPERKKACWQKFSAKMIRLHFPTLDEFSRFIRNSSATFYLAFQEFIDRISTFQINADYPLKEK
jgi:hypothetical protein